MVARQALATDYDFVPPSGFWDVSSNWSPNGVPGSGDSALIPSSSMCTIRYGVSSLNQVVLDGNAELIVLGSFLSSAYISFDGTGDPEIRIKPYGADNAGLLVYPLTTFEGNGSIVGDDSSASTGLAQVRGTGPAYDTGVISDVLKTSGTLYVDRMNLVIDSSADLVLGGKVIFGSVGILAFDAVHVYAFGGQLRTVEDADVVLGNVQFPSDEKSFGKIQIVSDSTLTFNDLISYTFNIPLCLKAEGTLVIERVVSFIAGGQLSGQSVQLKQGTGFLVLNAK